MFRNRIADFTFVLPRPRPPEPAPGAFWACPLPGPMAAWQQTVYAWAYEQARAAARPSLPERDLLGVWN